MKKILLKILCCLLGIAFVMISAVLFLQKALPTTYYNTIKHYAIENNLSIELVLSVIKTESGFNKNAISPSGAVGLMQLMPSTADDVAKELDISFFNLENEETNIKFGCFYLKKLLNKYSNEATALAAYNAGLGNVDLWLKNPNLSDDGISLKHIPFRETRNYVRKIYVYRTFYTNIFNI